MIKVNLEQENVYVKDVAKFSLLQGRASRSPRLQNKIEALPFNRLANRTATQMKATRS
jgi:hypothetical protein